ncbi:MAG TPA: hypothetical protein VHX63_02075 [Acidobacteriaceae bacterium]|nr:hypothetical protein [Acidobacteriaceae bacterium]
MSLRVRIFSIFAAMMLLAAILFCGSGALLAQDSDSGVNLALHANSHASAATIGLPAYPGATLYKEPGSDSPAQVLDFYRKPLSRYGEVLECDHGKPVGAMTVTRSGLTCSDEHGGHVQVNGSADSSSDHELRAGTPHRYRIVAVDASHDAAHAGTTRFGLVYLELPKDSDKSGTTN